MRTSARKIDRNMQPVMEYGIIDSRQDGFFEISTETGMFRASRAVSCIVSPEVGDLVLIALDDIGTCYILSILERAVRPQGNTDLAFDGNVNIRVSGGSLSLASDEGLSLASPNFGLDAREATVRIDKTSFFGRIVENNVAKIKLLAESMDSIIKRTVERVRSSYRYVEEHEEVQSASTRMIVDGTLTMHTKNTMHIAEGHVKIDAEQIHLG
jgi:hypothetical protein